MPATEWRLVGAVFSVFCHPMAADRSCSMPPSDLLMRGRFVDSLSARGLFTACTSSVTELVAISF